MRQINNGIKIIVNVRIKVINKINFNLSFDNMINTKHERMIEFMTNIVRNKINKKNELYIYIYFK